MSNPVKTVLTFTRTATNIDWQDKAYIHLNDTTDPRLQLTRVESSDRLTLTVTRKYATLEDYVSWNADPVVNDPADVVSWHTYNINNNITHTKSTSYTS